MRVRLLGMALGVATGLLALCGSALAQPSMGREHILPLFVSEANAMPSASGVVQQGFIRIINHSDKEATVAISGYDDAGEHRGPVTLTLGPKRTVHLNSGNVENGDAEKGLPEGLGSATGDWRLHLRSEQDIEPVAYIRTKPDGFLTRMSAVTPAGGMRHRVSIFNPASNFNQRSWLRLINLSDVEANVTISGLDDAGVAAPDGEVRLSLAAREAKAVTSEALESGASDLTGSFGQKDAGGKWQLTVTADQPILVMSLLSTPTGHLSNLSAPKADYPGPAGVWEVVIEDGTSGGYLIATPDSRLYAWLPESDETRIADATYDSDAGSLAASGKVYESGEVDIVGTSLAGGSEPFELEATYRQGDWITGEYRVDGVSRTFNGWAFTGFDRGADAAALAGDWETSDLEYSVDATAEFSGELDVDSFTCELVGTLVGINPAFNLYESTVDVDCTLLRLDVELILAVTDLPDAPGGGDQALALIIARDDEIAVGAIVTR